MARFAAPAPLSIDFSFRCYPPFATWQGCRRSLTPHFNFENRNGPPIWQAVLGEISPGAAIGSPACTASTVYQIIIGLQIPPPEASTKKSEPKARSFLKLPCPAHRRSRKGIKPFAPSNDPKTLKASQGLSVRLFRGDLLEAGL